MGETHWTPLGKSALIVETMMLHVSLKLGITTLYKENNSSSLSLRKQLADLAPKIRQQSAEEYQKFENDMLIGVHLLKQPSLRKALTIHATLPNSVSDPDQYNRHISNYIRRKKTSGVLLTGLKHLQGLSQDKLLNNDYAVFLVAAPIPEQLRAIEGGKNDPAIEFVLTSPKVQRFTVTGKLIDTRVDDLLKMVYLAKDNFKQPVEKDRLRPLPPLEQASQPVGPIESSPPAYRAHAHITRLFGSSSSIYSQPSLGQKADSFAIPSPDAPISKYPLETIPITPLVILGFWAGSKLGLCFRLPPNAIPITWSNPQSAKAAEEITREVSAERFFTRQGSSLEAASIHCFDKTYTKGALEEKQKIRAFIIDVVLGDVTPELGKTFNQYSQISDGELRSKKLMELMNKQIESYTQPAWSSNR